MKKYSGRPGQRCSMRASRDKFSNGGNASVGKSFTAA